MLATHLEDHDTIGQWMAHHLAELILAAQDDASTTVEQRLQIVETILKVWTHRRYYPGRVPLEEFSSVFEALDRLGDDTPWKFSRLFGTDTDIPDPGASGLPLVTTAAQLERLTRGTLIRLIWLEAQNAKEKNQEWLDVADKVTSNLESEVTANLSQLRRRLARQLPEEDHPKDSTKTAVEIMAMYAGVDGTPDGMPESLAESAVANDATGKGLKAVKESRPDDENDESNPLSDRNHIKRLREMATLLNKIADALAAPKLER